MSIHKVGILNIFRLWQAYRKPQAGEVWLIPRETILILRAAGPLRS
jgi:hypothetical protein